MKISVAGGAEIPDKEQFAAWDYFAAKLKAEGRELESLTLRVDPDDPDYLECTYKVKPKPFERIRRITGYLVGTVDGWNDAKREELRDRVVHE